MGEIFLTCVVIERASLVSSQEGSIGALAANTLLNFHLQINTLIGILHIIELP